MSQDDQPGRRPGRRGGLMTGGAWVGVLAALAGVAGLVAVVIAAFADYGDDPRGLTRLWLPGTDDTTDFTAVVGSLWEGSWVAAMALGVLVWGLIVWCVAKYRRRPDETGLPAQLRYNVPLEILYTAVPIFVISVLFYYTARDQAAIEARPADPDVTIEVVGKQWSWDFNYLDADVYETGRMSPVGNKDINEIIPTLYLPAGQSVELVLRSRDVVHSFWVPAFNYKKDVIPGRTNYWAFTPQEEGLYVGKCAELCGQYHPQMLFNVEVVSPERYEEELQALRDAGQTGSLPTNIGRILTGDREEDQIGTQPGAEYKY